MKTEWDIVLLANDKLKSAEILLQAGQYSDAQYLAGYVFELMLKAKICKTLLINDFFDFDNSKNRKLPINKVKKLDKENMYKPYKVHDYEQLIMLSGLFTVFHNKLETDTEFDADWYVISMWDESFRYIIKNNKNDVESFINSIKKMTSWLQQYL